MVDPLARTSRSAESGTPWWHEAPTLQHTIETQVAGELISVCYELGDAVLEVVTDDRPLLELFSALYSDCQVPLHDLPDIRFAIRRASDASLVLLSLERGVLQDAAAVAIPMLRATRATAPFRTSDSPVQGWHLSGGDGEPVVAVAADCVLIDTDLAPLDFVVEYAVALVLAAQPDVFVLHAAGVNVGGVGVLLTAHSFGGKSTLSLELAARGHALLGDDIMVVELSTGSLIQVRRAVNLRPGPRSAQLTEALERQVQRPDALTGTRWSRPVRVGELFPESPPDRVPLRAVFLLDGFADEARLTRQDFTFRDGKIFECLSSNEAGYVSFGVTPQQRALRMIALRQLLSGCACFVLKIGTAEDTVGLIEQELEKLQC